MPSKSKHTLDMPAANFGLPDPSEFNDFSGMVSFAGTVDLVPDRSARFCLFDRASRCWWDPRFDSDVLESQYRQTTFPRIRRRLQICLLFALCAALLWCVFLGVAREWWLLGLLLVVGLVPFLVVFIMSGSGRLPGHTDLIACTTALTLCLLSLIPAAARLSFFPGGHAISELQLSAWAVVTIMLIYTMIPLPLYGSVLISLVYSLLLEALNYKAIPTYFLSGRVMAVRAGLHMCVHLMGLRILVLALSHMRNTFSTVGQSLLTRQQLELEKQLKEHMIHSVMPPTLADWVQDELRDEVRQVTGGSCNSRAPREPPGRLCPAGPEISFRPFNMQPMDKVSILFADIVGFTRMSSNKSAEQLVGLLNDLFGRFDALCTLLDCEKISTLGDCYYCVSGCPEPRTDHAHCCVRMGLAMIAAIRDFDVANSEDVNMRVGVHTGRVLCGLVGTKRFKFDVWSNDVSMANRMESTGKPGKVHISEKTLCYLDNRFLVSPGDTVLGMRTYFIVGQKDAATPGSEPASPAVDSEHPYHAGFKKTRSLPNVIETNLANMTDIDSRRWTLDRRKKPRFRLPPSPGGDIKGSRKSRGDPRRTSGANPLQPLHEENSSYTDVPFRDLKDCESDAGSDPAPSDSEQDHSDSSESLMSGHSRKDSGIRSRRSSIQAQIAALNGLRPDAVLQHRLSDYYTSSQSSLAEIVNLETFGGLSTASCGDPGELLRQQAMQRKLSDLQMIRCVRQMSTQSNYFLNPPVDPFTLHYHSDELERQYRHQQTRLHHANCNTISLPEYNILVDTAVAALLLLVVSVSAFSSYSLHPHWLVGVGVCLVLLLLLQVVMWLRLRTYSVQGGRYRLIYSWFTSWYSFHVIGSIIISLPVAAVLSTWSCANFSDHQHMGLYFFLFFLCLCHFCNFTQLNFWMKSLLASLSAIAVFVLVAMHASDDCLSKFQSEMVAVEIVSCSLVLTILVWILNREFEISYRLGFCVNLLAAQDKCRVQKLMNQADWLLHNIIPRHVAEVIKTKAKYSENHSDVAVVFASIINFNDLYDETYRGGKEYLRVLNEIIGDIDDLLERYPCVEKIKTIGSTYMAASGLNPSQREHAGPLGRDQHLQELMLFALDMQNVVEAFNASLFEFEMQLRIGYNLGDVTAGVIGTTKLYYDIWGDTVNTASRMDGTGVARRIHTTGACAERLKPYFVFEKRGEIFVKGKDYMVTYFVNGRRTDGDTTG